LKLLLRHRAVRKKGSQQEKSRGVFFFCEMKAQRLGRYSHKRTAFLLCDVQEKFRNLIHVFPSVVNVSKTLITASRIFEIPLIVTEQKPTALGNTGTPFS
jgi:hypothetical protein